MSRKTERTTSTEGDAGGGTLGTFSGVFTPSILTILGIILFLRLGFVTGAAGIGRALLIILMANVISILTSISLSAIATNLRVKGGGDYYLISRTLGVEYGGALGLVLFLAQSVSIAFYAIGFGEALCTMIGAETGWLPQAIAAAAVLLLFVLAWLGSDWASRFQYVVMVVLFAAIVAFFAGALPQWSTDRLFDNFAPGILPEPMQESGPTMPFWVIFALFFPAVTGFTQGVSMSGDLKHAGRSLPGGTFAAVGLSLVVYIAMALVFAATLPATELVSDYGAMRRISLFPWLVDAGVIAATLSSALASFLGAPRILQSLAADRVFPMLNLFSVGHGTANNPRRGVLLSAAIAFGTIALGDLNVIAPIVSMFFLISYGSLNYATFVEARAHSPSFRPRFRFFNARLSLVGGLGCLGAMLAIHPAAAVIGVVVLFALYQYVSATVSIDRWADSERSQRFQRMREDLHALSRGPMHPRYWRPVLLAFSDDPERRERLLRFASWVEGKSGLTTVVRLVTGEGLQARRMRQEAEAELEAEIERHNLPAFPRVIVAPDIEQAVPVVLQSYGLGPVRANTVLLNWFDQRGVFDDNGLSDYARYLRLALRFSCNLVILGAGTEDFEAIAGTRAKDLRIDVWHRNNATGRLMLLLAYLMTRTEQWEDARICLFATPAQDKTKEETLAELEAMLEEVRIVAKVEVVDEADPQTVIRHSAESAVSFLPFGLGESGLTCIYGTPAELVEGLGLSAFVLAAQDIVLDTDPEGGEYAEITQAVDAADKAQEKVRKTDREAQKTAELARQKQERLATAQTSGAGEVELAEIESESRLADEDAERSRRRAAKARAKAESAAEEAETITGQRSDKDGEKTDPADG